MRVSSLVAVLSTLLVTNLVVAEPIPIRASHAKPHDEVDALVLKRDESKLYTKDGWGARYWAWSRVAYDAEWNSVDDSRLLRYDKQKDKDGKEEDRKWALLADNDDIWIRGSVGAKLANAGFMWTSIETTQHAIVAVDKNNKEIVVAYQGTETFWHLLQDSKANKHSVPKVDGQVHLGFGECFETLENTTTRHLRTLLEVEEYQKYPIVFTGHSLGGATALIAAAHYTELWPSIAERTWAFTYGAPNSGNEDFQFALQVKLGPRLYNFRHFRDPIPWMPTVTKKWLWGGFANPAGRYVFRPKGNEKDSWFDQTLWKHIAPVNHKGIGYSGSAYQLAKGLWKNGLAWHTGYFQDDQLITDGSDDNLLTDDSDHEVSTDKDRPQDSDDSAASKLRKRDAPSATDLQTGSSLIQILVTGTALSAPPKYAPGEVWRMAKPLRFEHDEAELWETIKKLPDRESRIAFFNLVWLTASSME